MKCSWVRRRVYWQLSNLSKDIMWYEDSYKVGFTGADILIPIFTWKCKCLQWLKQLKNKSKVEYIVLGYAITACRVCMCVCVLTQWITTGLLIGAWWIRGYFQKYDPLNQWLHHWVKCLIPSQSLTLWIPQGLVGTNEPRPPPWQCADGQLLCKCFTGYHSCVNFRVKWLCHSLSSPSHHTLQDLNSFHPYFKEPGIFERNLKQIV